MSAYAACYLPAMLPVMRSALLKQLLDLALAGKDLSSLSSQLVRDGLDVAAVLEWLQSESPAKSAPVVEPDAHFAEVDPDPEPEPE